jgi:hypothetical protein
MAAKTYVPGLRDVLRAAYRYISRYATFMQPFLTESQREHVATCLADLTTCLLDLGETPVVADE